MDLLFSRRSQHIAGRHGHAHPKPQHSSVQIAAAYPHLTNLPHARLISWKELHSVAATMTTFLSDLWESVFTPGPTPTLLIATNAAFASLQVLLLALLAATYSVHFFVLSILCGGLWWAINWFAGELAAAQKAEEEAKRIREARRAKGAEGQSGSGEVDWGAEGGDEQEDTETETEELRGRAKGRKGGKEELLQPKAPPGSTSGASTGGDLEGLSKRKSLSDAGELSTDSEWEKVDEER